jgi:hypothetical protein
MDVRDKYGAQSPVLTGLSYFPLEIGLRKFT